jgi:hypothetical protein
VLTVVDADRILSAEGQGPSSSALPIVASRLAGGVAFLLFVVDADRALAPGDAAPSSSALPTRTQTTPSRSSSLIPAEDAVRSSSALPTSASGLLRSHRSLTPIGSFQAFSWGRRPGIIGTTTCAGGVDEHARQVESIIDLHVDRAGSAECGTFCQADDRSVTLTLCCDSGTRSRECEVVSILRAAQGPTRHVAESHQGWLLTQRRCTMGMRTLDEFEQHGRVVHDALVGGMGWHGFIHQCSLLFASCPGHRGQRSSLLPSQHAWTASALRRRLMDICQTSGPMSPRACGRHGPACHGQHRCGRHHPVLSGLAAPASPRRMRRRVERGT